MSDTAKAPRKTIAQLEAIVADVTANLGRTREAFDAQRRELQAAVDRDKATRAQFDDLKIRLSTAEAENQRMRGYIARVQEDDTVREELVPIGDPAGEQQLVPKRKSTLFHQPNGYSDLAGDCSAMSHYERQNRPTPKHWIAY